MANELTVIIPVYNRETLVRRTLESLRAQTAPGFDTVLVDNGSSDSSLTVLRQWAADNASAERPVRVLSEHTPGACAARNAGLAACATPWVLFFDSDDEMAPGHIARVLEGIRSHPTAQVLGWDTYHTGLGVRRFRVSDIEWYNVFEGNFATQRWAAPTELVRRAGGWNREIKLWDDIELGSRLLALHPEVVRLEGEPTVTVHPQEVSISTNASGDYLERMEASLQSIASRLAPEQRIWTDYVRMIVAGNTYRSAPDAKVRQKALAVARKAAGRAPSLRHRLLMWSTYHFRRLGGRGQNRVLKLILSKKL